MLAEIHSLLLSHAVPRTDQSPRFFKTGKGEYAEGDQFLGVCVPTLRKLARQFQDLSQDELSALIQSPFNEERLLALIILTYQFEKTSNPREIYVFYMNHRQYVNNWNLVDASAHLIVGAYLFGKETSVLHDLAQSPSLWDRRIAIVATAYFIRKGQLDLTFEIAEILLHDQADLIHKATGWMCREAGKRDPNRLIAFLNQHVSIMPRTMLRAAIEKLDEDLRQQYLHA